MGEYEKAALLFEELINNDLQNLAIYEKAVDNWRKANKIKKAIAVLNKLEYNIGIDPQILLQKAALFEMMEDNNSALSQLLLANKKFPGDTYVLNTLLDFYMSRGNDSDCILVLKELLDADPSDVYALILL